MLETNLGPETFNNPHIKYQQGVLCKFNEILHLVKDVNADYHESRISLFYDC